VGPFDVRDAVAPSQFPCAVSPLAAAVPHLPRRSLDDGEYDAVRRGRSIAARAEPPGPVALFHAALLVAVAAREGDVLQPRTVLAG
jgi:hypothetical protein